MLKIKLITHTYDSYKKLYGLLCFISKLLTTYKKKTQKQKKILMSKEKKHSLWLGNIIQ